MYLGETGAEGVVRSEGRRNWMECIVQERNLFSTKKNAFQSARYSGRLFIPLLLKNSDSWLSA